MVLTGQAVRQRRNSLAVWVCYQGAAEPPLTFCNSALAEKGPPTQTRVFGLAGSPGHDSKLDGVASGSRKGTEEEGTFHDVFEA